MSEPFIFMTTADIKEGQLEAWTKNFEEFAQFIDANEPRLLHFAMYVDDDGTGTTILQVHPDPDSMATHLELIADHVSSSGDYLDYRSARSRVYGTPSQELLERIREVGGGIPLTVSTPEGGFNRLPER